jgi:hypothetical protein
LPEPHTDYIFSVIGEEFGIIACLAIAILYMTIVVRVLVRLLNEEDKFLVPRNCRPGHPIRSAGFDQHGGQRPYRAVQGHDLAVHLLWRLVDDRAGDGLRPSARLQPPQSAPSRLALCSAMEGAEMISRHYVLAAAGRADTWCRRTRLPRSCCSAGIASR